MNSSPFLSGWRSAETVSGLAILGAFATLLVVPAPALASPDPTLQLVSPAANETWTRTPSLHFDAYVNPPNSTVFVNAVQLLPQGDGRVEANYSLSEGANTFEVVVIDWLSNQINRTVLVHFDVTPPILIVDAPANGLLTNRTSIDVFGRTEPDATVIVNGLAATVDSVTGNFSRTQVALDDLFDQTENLLVIRAVDRAGNVRYENRSVIVDTKAPTIDLDLEPEVRSRIEAGLPISSANILIQGTTDSADAVITISGQGVALTGFSFSLIVMLAEGLNDILIRSEDAAGNTREVTLHVTRDTTAPALTLLTPATASFLTNQTTLKITGYTDDGASIISITYLDTRGILATDVVPVVSNLSTGHFDFSYTLALNTDGNPKTVEVRAIDAAGNAYSTAFTYTSKVGRPFLEIQGFKTSISEPFVWINGTTEAGIVAVMINGSEYPVTGQFFAVRIDLPAVEENYTFIVAVRDDAGNWNIWTFTTHLRFPPPPSPPLPASLNLTVNGSASGEVAAGSTVRLALNLTNASAFNITWFVDGALAGTGAELVLSLTEGTHNITANVSNGEVTNTYEFHLVARGAASAPPAPTPADASRVLWVAIAAAALAAAGFLAMRRRKAS